MPDTDLTTALDEIRQRLRAHHRSKVAQNLVSLGQPLALAEALVLENLEVVPDNIHDKGLKSAYEEANIQTWTQEELNAYDYAFMREEDERARLDKAKMQAEMKGEKRGEMRGEKRKEEESVIGFYDNGVSIAIIAMSLKISEDKVVHILKKHKKH